MKIPLVLPSTEKEDKDFQELIQFFNETLGFCLNSVKTMYHRPAIAYAFIELNKAVMQKHTFPNYQKQNFDSARIHSSKKRKAKRVN
jgi:hypothetical protein